ncbi:hypothetical protein C6A85_000000113935, partial [Mycobacterium sp. ITM-2017-0098]
KSFRIMLGHRQISYTDLHRVVTALVERKHLELDYNRYRHPYDLHGDGEWPHLLAAVELEELREQMHQSRNEPPRP